MKSHNTIFTTGRCSQLFIIYWLIVIIIAFGHLDICDAISYTSFAGSDWLINYEAGFVRRGLDGQLLYWLYQLHPFSPILAVKHIVCVSSILLLMLTLRVFSREGWSLSVLPFCFCMLSILFLVEARRDTLMLLMAYGVFVCYRNVMRGKRKQTATMWLLAFAALSIVMILSHEASFFFTYPIMMVYGWKRAIGRNVTLKRLAIWLLPFLPGLLAMVSVCLFKGNEHMAQAIWASWSDAFIHYPDGVNSAEYTFRHVGLGVQALGWGTTATMKMHASINFLAQYPVKELNWLSVLQTPTLLWTYFCAYYLTTRLNTVAISLYPIAKAQQQVRISNVLLVQFLALLPMLTVLSMDLGRPMAYCTLSSLFALHIFGDLNIKPVNRISEALQSWIERHRLNRTSVFLLIAVLTPFMRWGGQSYEALSFAPLIRVLSGLINGTY